MDKQKLLELAERVEGLSGACREVDAAVVTALFPDAQVGEYCGYEDIVFHAAPLVANKEFLPFFTASIDSAMTLVPEGYDWVIGRTNGGLTIHAEVGGRGDEYMRFGETPALALTAASLRAKAAMIEDE